MLLDCQATRSLFRGCSRDITIPPENKDLPTLRHTNVALKSQDKADAVKFEAISKYWACLIGRIST